MDCGLCFIDRLGNDNALAECKSVSLDDDRRLLGVKIFDGLSLVIEKFIFGRRDVVLLHEALGESLGTLNDRGIRVRSESAEACCLHLIYHAEYERIVRCNEDKIKLLCLCIFDHGINIGRTNVLASSDLGYSAVTGSAVKLRNLGTLLKSSADRMFSSAAADYQYLHNRSSDKLD